jgi:HAMP domain-containing protein
MSETRQEKALEALRDWSKWLIGISFGAATGCVIVLEAAPAVGPATPWLVAAIVAFALSVLCAVILVREAARVIERLPMRDAAGKVSTVFDHELAARLSIGTLAQIQLALLAAGVVLFLGWVIVKPGFGAA